MAASPQVKSGMMIYCSTASAGRWNTPHPPRFARLPSPRFREARGISFLRERPGTAKPDPGEGGMETHELHVEGLAAAAAALFVGIAEDKPGLQLALFVIDYGAEDEQRRL